MTIERQAQELWKRTAKARALIRRIYELDRAIVRVISDPFNHHPADLQAEADAKADELIELYGGNPRRERRDREPPRLHNRRENPHFFLPEQYVRMYHRDRGLCTILLEAQAEVIAQDSHEQMVELVQRLYNRYLASPEHRRRLEQRWGVTYTTKDEELDSFSLALSAWLVTYTNMPWPPNLNRGRWPDHISPPQGQVWEVQGGSGSVAGVASPDAGPDPAPAPTPVALPAWPARRRWGRAAQATDARFVRHLYGTAPEVGNRLLNDDTGSHPILALFASELFVAERYSVEQLYRILNDNNDRARRSGIESVLRHIHSELRTNADTFETTYQNQDWENFGPLLIGAVTMIVAGYDDAAAQDPESPDNKLGEDLIGEVIGMTDDELIAWIATGVALAVGVALSWTSGGASVAVAARVAFFLIGSIEAASQVVVAVRDSAIRRETRRFQTVAPLQRQIAGSPAEVQQRLYWDLLFIVLVPVGISGGVSVVRVCRRQIGRALRRSSAAALRRQLSQTSQQAARASDRLGSPPAAARTLERSPQPVPATTPAPASAAPNPRPVQAVPRRPVRRPSQPTRRARNPRRPGRQLTPEIIARRAERASRRSTLRQTRPRWRRPLVRHTQIREVLEQAQLRDLNAGFELLDEVLPRKIDAVVDRFSTGARRARADVELDRIYDRLSRMMRNHPDASGVLPAAEGLLRRARRLARSRFNQVRRRVWRELYNDDEVRMLLRSMENDGLLRLPRGFPDTGSAPRLRARSRDWIIWNGRRQGLRLAEIAGRLGPGANPRYVRRRLREIQRNISEGRRPPREFTELPLNLDHITPLQLNPFRWIDAGNLRVLSASYNDTFLRLYQMNAGSPMTDDVLEAWIRSNGLNLTPAGREALLARRQAGNLTDEAFDELEQSFGLIFSE